MNLQIDRYYSIQKLREKKRVKKVQIQKRTALQQIVLGQLSTQYAKKKIPWLYLNPYTKINSKWFLDLNVKHKSIRLLKGDEAEYLCDLELGNEFLDMKSNSWSVK